MLHEIRTSENSIHKPERINITSLKLHSIQAMKMYNYKMILDECKNQ